MKENYCPKIMVLIKQNQNLMLKQADDRIAKKLHVSYVQGLPLYETSYRGCTHSCLTLQNYISLCN